MSICIIIYARIVNKKLITIFWKSYFINDSFLNRDERDEAGVGGFLREKLRESKAFMRRSSEREVKVGVRGGQGKWEVK